ncbi:MAG TPA: glycosyltransferase family 2 protein [Vicinamibacterales bacterium]|jgi:hypothetical protein
MGPTGALIDGNAGDTVTPGPAAADRAPLVSIVIVNYKSYAELEACLASLTSDGKLGAEVVVIDHASSEPDLERVRARYPRIRLFATDRNPGFSAGVNAGARVAKGRHLLILNPDTVIQPGSVQQMVDYLEMHADTAVVGARVQTPGGTVQRSARRFPTMLTGLAGRTSLITRIWPDNPLSRHDLLADASTAGPIDVDWVAGTCMAVNAHAFETIGGMDEQFFLYWEDADLCKRLKEAGWRVVYLPSAVVTHGIGRSRRHAPGLSIRAFHRSAYRYFVKHRAARFRMVSLPVAGAVLYARMALMLAVQAIARRGQSDR